jgi:hypothetical protein
MLPVEYQLQNKELVKQWVEALRSGKYEQVKGILRKELENGYGHCCLGVLCEVIKPLITNSEDLAYLEDNLEKGCYPPLVALKHLQSKYTNQQLISVLMPDNTVCAVTTLNDDLNKSFAEIADLLEQTHLKDGEDKQ